MFSYISPEQRVRKDHPLRPIRAMVDQVLKELSPRFDKMYAKVWAVVSPKGAKTPITSVRQHEKSRQNPLRTSK